MRTECLANPQVFGELFQMGNVFELATTMLNGADLAAVLKLMGHSAVKMTADFYYHYLEGEKEKTEGKLLSLVRS